MHLTYLTKNISVEDNVLHDETEIWKEYENKPALTNKRLKKKISELKEKKEKGTISKDTFREQLDILFKKNSPPLKEKDNKVVKVIFRQFKGGLLDETWSITKSWECYQICKSKSGKKDIVFHEPRHAKVEGFAPYDWYRKEGNFNESTRFESRPNEI